jgi:hypothetical protein
MNILDFFKNIFNRQGTGAVDGSIGSQDDSTGPATYTSETAIGDTTAYSGMSMSSEMEGIASPSPASQAQQDTGPTALTNGDESAGTQVPSDNGPTAMTNGSENAGTPPDAPGLVDNPALSTPAAEHGLAQAASVASPNGLPVADTALTYDGFPSDGSYGGFPDGGSYGGFPSDGSYGGFPSDGSYGGFPDGTYTGFPDSGASYGGFPSDGSTSYTGFPSDGGTATYTGFPDGSSYSTNPMATDGQSAGAVVADFNKQYENKPAQGWADTSAEKPQDLSGGMVAAAGDDSRETDPLTIKDKRTIY